MTSEITWGQGYAEPDPGKVERREKTVADMIMKRVAATPDWEAFQYPPPDDSTPWTKVTWAEVGERVRKLTAGLIALGIRPEERVAIASTTRYEWILADFAVMCAGAATTTVYPTTTPDDVSFILSDSGSRVVFAEDADQVAKVLEHHEDLPEVVAVVVLNGVTDGIEGDPTGRIEVLSFAELEGRGAAHLEEHPDTIDQAMAAIGPDTLATLIYTSGTTGRPKGVRLAHDCWTYEGTCIDAVNLLTKEDFQFLWLPLSHVFGKVLLTAQLEVGFSTAVDGRIDRIIENLEIVKPRWMCAAPRVFEKAYSRIVTTIEQEGGVKAKLFGWAFEVGGKVSKLRQNGKEPTGMLKVQHSLADKLVLSKIRERFGGNLRFLVSGSAALNREIAEWFHAAGMLIIEGYGLTETSAATFVNLPGIYRFGTVGPPFPGTEVQIADDGEVLVKGPGVMHGYHNLPEQTAEMLTDDGWCHTGDIGEVTDEGLLKITDRKKDLIKTSGGKYVAPQLIEAQFKTLCPYASQIIVHGDGRNFVSALVTLDPDAIAQWATQQPGLTGKDYKEIVNSDAARTMVQSSVDQLNAKLNRWETIKKFVILDQDLTVEEGAMTPSLKVKRRVVEKRYADVLEAMYS